jgi:3-hydroxymyristoyl/3-hydroxydecanoyl-(acyl carrier protein) dehydratase
MQAEVQTARYCVDPTHPALPGHFPGDPIVPAALLLRFVAQTLERAGRPLTGIERMKFLRPVRPGEVIDVTVAPVDSRHGTVAMTIAGEPVARGVWLCSPD